MTIEKDLSSLINSKFDVLIVGDNGVGKSTLLYKYITGLFREELPSEECVRIKSIDPAYVFSDAEEDCDEVPHGDAKPEISILDSSLSLTSYLTDYSYLIKNATSFLFAYSIDSMESFEALEYQMECIKALKVKNGDSFICAIVALKMDLYDEQQVPVHKGLALRERFSAVEFHEVSSKMDSSVEQVFRGLAREAIIYDREQWALEASRRAKAAEALTSEALTSKVSASTPSKLKRSFRSKLRKLLSPKSK